ncbi:hypothetical protein Egran_00416 [Elaphomyces granulatus]|uniref:Nickel/cobalt efflux system n=1 Tax=Elaphomyces granulatus TaxID=519963 RepID=A0A232M5Z7_9EURO|nr:hypothetical protein Egran_00416 [Elaphomyces granulatus]
MTDEVPFPIPENGPTLCVVGDNQKGPVIGNNNNCISDDIDSGGLEQQGQQQQQIRKSFLGRAQRTHRRLPGINKIPLPAIFIIVVVAMVNMVAWAVAGVVLAIDLMTRRLLATGQKSVTVGTFFSLGHSTIVIITSIVVAATAATVSKRFDNFSTVGGIIGSSVSAAFLILLGTMNAYILYKLVMQIRKVLNNLQEGEEAELWRIEGGILSSLLKKMFWLIDRPWKMYPLGVLFGLGFDTSSEIALLGISSIQAARGTSFWVILIFPILFTAGMCLLDTVDGALILSLYVQPAANFLIRDDNSPDRGSTGCASSNAHDPVAFLYYSIILTALTVIVAVVIGILQLLNLILNVAGPEGKFWDGVEAASNNYDKIGGGICGSFIVFGLISVALYKPWRRWIEMRQGRRYDR